MKDLHIRNKTDEYLSLDEIDFSIITNGLKWLPFFEDDTFLGMQAMNVGITDSVITDYEYHLLNRYIEIEKTPTQEALIVGAFSQMWVYALYEVLRLWRDRRFDFASLYKNGGVDLKLKSINNEDEMNFTLQARKRQLTKYRDDKLFRVSIDDCWNKIEPVYRIVELYRMNLAKHTAPGKKNVIPMAPGYGRINMRCGSLDNELIFDKDNYELLNRRDIADRLRDVLLDIKDTNNA
jgi:hypothetical protein